MAEIGDRVQVPSKKVGSPPREGVVTAVVGSLLRVAWSSGEESLVTPSMGSLLVVGRSRGRTVTGGPSAPSTAGAKAAAKKRPGATGSRATRRGVGGVEAGQAKTPADRPAPKRPKGEPAVAKGTKAAKPGPKDAKGKAKAGKGGR